MKSKMDLFQVIGLALSGAISCMGVLLILKGIGLDFFLWASQLDPSSGPVVGILMLSIAYCALCISLE